jgi:hypothetical protein
MKKKKGICRLCGDPKDLSFEHIPPESAFNDHPLVLQTLHDRIQGRSHRKFRIALGADTLCESCNKLTGGWYGAAYAQWARQGLVWLDYLGEGHSFQLSFDVRPLNVLKQVLAMALAMAPEASIPYHEELRAFVLNRTQKYLPPRYNVYAYLTGNKGIRFESGMAVLNPRTGAMNYIDAEIAFPPFGYCITSTRHPRHQSKVQEINLYDIGWFSHFEYNQQSPIYLKLPKLQVNTQFPLDYRTPAEIERDYNEQASLPS